MTKIKKTLALMMVLVMAMTTLSLPASATQLESEIEPISEVIPCSKCGDGAYSYYQSVDEAWPTITSASNCYKGYADNHTHYTAYRYYYVVCPTCGTYKLSEGYVNICYGA